MNEVMHIDCNGEEAINIFWWPHQYKK